MKTIPFAIVLTLAGAAGCKSQERDRAETGQKPIGQEEGARPREGTAPPATPTAPPPMDRGTTADEPSAGVPATGGPATGAPATGGPATGEPTAGEPTTGEPAAAAPAAGAMKAQSIPSFKLTFEGPSDAKIIETPEGVVIDAAGMMFAISEPKATSGSPTSLDSALETTRKAGANVTKQEELPGGGYDLQYESEQAGQRLYFVEIRRALGDKVYDCKAASPNATAAAAAARACMSLKPQ